MLANPENILVTGGAGYIGAHVCKALHAAGYVPVVYDNLSRGHRSAVKWGPLEVGELHDQRRLEEVLGEYKPAAVMHFAAYAYVGESVADPAVYYQNNVVGTLELLDAMLKRGVKKIVFSSTCATYGDPVRIPLDESHPQGPISPYGSSKLMIEKILDDYDNAYGLRYMALRYFNAAGADRDGDIGECHVPETHIIPLILQTALGQRDRIAVFGDDYDTLDGSCVRDYIHVEDLAQAHVLAMRFLLTEGSESVCLNLGVGKGYSVFELIEAAETITGKRIAVDVQGRRAGDPPVLIADSRKARKKLGWIPKYSDLHTIISTAWQWSVKQGKQ